MDTHQAPVYRGSLDKLLSKIHDEHGMDLGDYRRPYLERRIGARLRSVGVHTYRQYSDLLDRDSAEYDRLIDTLTINVTDFFRDKPVWDAIRRRVVPDLIAEKSRSRSRTVRIWSAGCATGEEPYSIAMCMLDALGDDADRFLISVLGTDLDPEALAVAGRAVYTSDKLRHIPSSYQVRFTKMKGAGEFEIAPEVRKIVRLAPFNLFDESPLRVVDLVLCRNVFIYLDRARQAKVLENFLRAMGRNSYLVLGRSEKLTTQAAQSLVAVDAKERIYQKPVFPTTRSSAGGSDMSDDGSAHGGD